MGNMDDLMRWLADTIGPGPAVALVGLTTGGIVFAVGGLIILWRTR